MIGLRNRLSAALLAGSLLAPLPALAGAASDWAKSPRTTVRLIGGDAAERPQGPILIAGVEIRMEEGWKTYWRTPGDAGGVPPNFDWAGSSNVAEARVLYPAPHRFTDQAGSTVGYKGSVVFPVEVRPQDPKKPVVLKLAVAYGVCKDVCIPAEAKLELNLGGKADAETGPILARSLGMVPRTTKPAAGDPVVASIKAEIAGLSPRLVLDAKVPKGAAGVDMFIEAADGAFVPLPTIAGKGADGAVQFVCDLSKGVDLADLKEIGRAHV